MTSRNNKMTNSEGKMPLKSINNRKCLTKCFPAGKTYLHPVFLYPVIRTVDSCAIDPIYVIESEDNRETTMIDTEVCNLEDNETHELPNEIEALLLSFSFYPKDFLENIYGLVNFDQVIFWTLQNDHLPFYTIKRVHNCAWKAFGNDFERLSANVLEYYFNISKTYWLKKYTKNIQNKYSFEFITKKKEMEISNSFEEIYNILLSKFYTYDFFISTIRSYINVYQEKWEQINSHYDELKKFIFDQFISYIENKMANK